MQIVKNFRNVIHMKFELDKCTKIVLKKEKLVHSQNLIFDIRREIQELKEGKTYE
jgi:hypothetical protein